MKNRSDHIKSTASNGLLGIIGVFVSSALRLLAAVALTHILSPDDYGKFVILFSFIMIIAIFAGMGMSDALLRWGAIDVQKNRGRRLGALVRFGFLVAGAATAFLALLILLADDHIAGLLDGGVEAFEIRLILLALPLIVVADILSSVARARESILAFYGIKSLVQSAAMIALVITLVAWLPTVPMAIAGFVLSYAAAVMFGVYYLKSRAVPAAAPATGGDGSDIDRAAIFRFGGAAAAISMLWLFRDRIPVFYMGKMVTPADAGVFFNATRLSILMEVILAGLNAILSPKVAVLHAAGKVDELRVIYQSIVRWAMLAILPAALFMLLEPDFTMATVFGAGSPHAGDVLFWLVLFGLFSLTIGSPRVLLQMSGNSAHEIWVILSLVVVMIPLLYWALLLWGAVGGAIATGAVILISNLFRMLLAWKKVGVLPVRSIDFLMVTALLAGIALVNRFYIAASHPLTSMALTIILSLAAMWLLATKDDRGLLNDVLRKLGMSRA